MVGNTLESSVIALKSISDFNVVEECVRNINASNMVDQNLQNDICSSASEVIVTDTSNIPWLGESEFGISVFQQKSLTSGSVPDIGAADSTPTLSEISLLKYYNQYTSQPAHFAYMM